MLQAGQSLGAYRIIEQLGRGGMAAVYKAHQAALDRFVALKILPPFLAEDPEFQERFRAEARTIADLHHASILTVYDYGTDGDVSYIVIELVEGGTLADLRRPVAAADVARLLAPIAAALDYAHERGILHRDLKPTNVLLRADGNPVLADFGLARMIGSVPHLTRTGQIVGTPAYMAPEQARGQSALPATDRYALAVIAYELLTGTVPYEADTPLATLLAHLHQPLPLPRRRNPDLPAGVEAVLLKGLAKEPSDRYPTAGEFARALAAAAEMRAAPVVRSRRSIVVAAGLVLAATGATALLLFVTQPRVQPAAETAGATRGVASPTIAAVAVPRKGAVLYTAKLDGTESDVVLPRYVAGNPAASDVRFVPGAIELVLRSAEADTAVNLRSDGYATYVGELDLAVEPRSTLKFQWGLRWAVPGKLATLLEVDAKEESMHLTIFNATADPAVYLAISPRVPIPGLQSGRTFTLGAVVEETRYRLYLDGKQVADVTEARVPASKTIQGLEVYGGTGVIRVLGIRTFALP